MIFQALDKMVQLCEKHEIGVIWSLSCAGFTNDAVHTKTSFPTAIPPIEEFYTTIWIMSSPV
jgi:hypothetical protein